MKYALLFALLTTLVHAQSIRAIYVNRSDAPLQINGLVNSMQDLASQIEFKNTSGKTITSFQIGWTTEVPASCTSSAVPVGPSVKFGPLEEVVILAGASSSSLSYKIGTGAALAQANQLGAHHMELEFGVVTVNFSDGTSWDFDLATAKSFDEHQMLTEFGCDAAFDARRAQATVCGPSGASAPAPLVASASSSAPVHRIVNYWLCNPTAAFVYCAYVAHPAPGCLKDTNGACCHTLENPIPIKFPQKICYLESY